MCTISHKKCRDAILCHHDNDNFSDRRTPSLNQIDRGQVTRPTRLGQAVEQSLLLIIYIENKNAVDEMRCRVYFRRGWIERGNLPGEGNPGQRCIILSGYVCSHIVYTSCSICEKKSTVAWTVRASVCANAPPARATHKGHAPQSRSEVGTVRGLLTEVGSCLTRVLCV